MPRPCRMRGLQLVDRWISRPRDPFAGLPKCPRGAGQKEVSCAGLRGRVLGAAVPHGGVASSDPRTGHPPLGRVLRALEGAGWCRLMHGWYGHDAGPTGGHLLVLSGTQSPWQVELQACLPLSASSR